LNFTIKNVVEIIRERATDGDMAARNKFRNKEFREQNN
jgi:hypothetical protein